MNSLARATAAAVVIALPTPAQDVPTHSLPTDTPGVELQTRDLAPLARRIDALRHASDPTARPPAERGSARNAVARQLADSVRAYLQPPLAEGEDVRLVAGRYLVSCARAAQQHWIDRFLRSQPTTAGDVIELEVHVFSAGITALEKAAIGDGPRALDPTAGAELAAAFERDRRARGEPNLVLWLGARALQPASLASGDQTSYVRDFALVGKAGGALVADPIVSTLRDGLEMTITATPLGAGRIGLRGALQLVDVLQPMPTKRVPLAGGVPVTLQVPATRCVRLPLEITLDDQGYAVLPGPLFEGRHLVAVLRARTAR